MMMININILMKIGILLNFWIRMIDWIFDHLFLDLFFMIDKYYRNQSIPWLRISHWYWYHGNTRRLVNDLWNRVTIISPCLIVAIYLFASCRYLYCLNWYCSENNWYDSSEWFDVLRCEDLRYTSHWLTWIWSCQLWTLEPASSIILWRKEIQSSIKMFTNMSLFGSYTAHAFVKTYSTSFIGRE
jgi:hypothetical protein